MTTPSFSDIGVEALRAGVRQAEREINALGGMDQFRRPGEHRAVPRNEDVPPPTLTAKEYIGIPRS